MADTPMKVVLDCSAPNKDRELFAVQAGIETVMDLVRGGKLTREDAESQTKMLLDHATDVVTAPAQVSYLELDESDLAQRTKDHDDATDEARVQLETRCTALLRSCDWTQLPDAGLTAAQLETWGSYRQALRDLPAQTSDPFSPDWPEAPA